MNKRIDRISALFLPLTALLLVSCAESTTIGAGTPDVATIRFGTPALSRAAINNAAEMQTDGNAFSVWGWYEQPDGTPVGQVFAAQNVSWSDNEASWGYNGTKYWFTGYVYDFYALYPSVEALNGATVTCAPTGALSVQGFDATKGVDLMTAARADILTQEGVSPGPVAFGFSHQLARLTFQIKVAGSDVTVSSFKVNGVVCRGDLTHAADGTDTWSNTASTADGDGLLAATDVAIASGETRNMLGDVLLPPHADLNAAEVSVTYRYAGETADRTSTVPLATTQIAQWSAGNHYSYTLSISAATLMLNVRILDWNEEDTSVSWQ